MNITKDKKTPAQADPHDEFLNHEAERPEAEKHREAAADYWLEVCVCFQRLAEEVTCLPVWHDDWNTYVNRAEQKELYTWRMTGTERREFMKPELEAISSFLGFYASKDALTKEGIHLYSQISILLKFRP